MFRRYKTTRLGCCIALGLGIGWFQTPGAMAEISELMFEDVTIQNEQDVAMIAIAPTTLTAAKIAEIDTYLDAHLETGRFSGNVIIHRNNAPALIRSYGLANHEHRVNNTPDTKFRIGSISKQFTAVAILQLQEQGLLDVEAPISTYLPDYPNGDRITIHHLLSHTAGIPEYLNGDIFEDLAEWIRLPSTLDQLIERFQDLPLEFEPGDQFKYSNSGYVLLTKILETVSEQPYADYLQTHILLPLGMHNTGYETSQTVIANLAQGYVFIGPELYMQTQPIDMSLPQGAGGLYSTLDDLAIWNQWLYGNDWGDDRSILSDTSIELLTTPIVSMQGEKDSSDAFYTYGLVHDTHLGRQRLHHSGGINGFLSTLMHYPEENLTIGILLNLDNQSPAPIAEGLAAILFDEDYDMPQINEAVEIDPAQLEKYVGTYQLLPELQVNLWIEESQLMGQATGQEAFVLYPSSDTTFFAQVADISIAFMFKADGTVEGFTLYQINHELFAPKLTD